MNNSDYEDFYFVISDYKIYRCFFENGEKYFKESINFEILIH